MSGVSKVMQWEDKRDNEKAEVKFYNMIIENSHEVEKAADKGIGKVKSLKAEVQPFKVKDLQGFYVKVAVHYSKHVLRNTCKTTTLTPPRLYDFMVWLSR